MFNRFKNGSATLRVAVSKETVGSIEKLLADVSAEQRAAREASVREMRHAFVALGLGVFAVITLWVILCGGKNGRS